MINSNGIEGQIELKESGIEYGSLMEEIYGQVRKVIREAEEQGLIFNPIRPVQVIFSFTFSKPEEQ